VNALERFARVTTVTATRVPRLWPVLRGPMRFMFDRIAPAWDTNRSPVRLTAFEAALATIAEAPARVLDLGTGTGDAAFAAAARWPEAEVLGFDLSRRMIDEARAKAPPELRDRIRFDVADARHLPVDDASFDLVAMNNMIPFADELARVTAPGGHLVVAFTRGAGTPIYVPFDRLRPDLERHGFEDVRELTADPGTAVVARRGARVP
jgi:SAM-dependent methyltransferase